MSRIQIGDTKNYLNRHLSWLEFNRRVLEEAHDEHNPLLERVKFLAITASNLDEFVEVRFAGLLQQAEHGYCEAGPDGLSPTQQLQRLFPEMHSFVCDQYQCWNEKLIPALAREGIRILRVADLDRAGRDAVDLYYTRQVDPVLTPVTIDPAHPFPHVINKALCVAFLLQKRRRQATQYLGVVTVPRKLPRLVRIARPNGKTIDYVFLHDLISTHARNLYHGYEILSASAFRATRNSNLYLHEEESRSILESIDTQLHARRKGDVVRLEVESQTTPEILEPLRTRFGLQPNQIFKTDGPVNLSRLFYLADHTPRPELLFRSFVPRDLTPKTRTVFEQLKSNDILLHHPFDSYNTVVSFLESAAHDPAVLSIKQTLYRTSADSPIVRALIEAAQANKEVTVVVELKARFDEASNIRWARNLEEAGVQVYHGLVGLKTHCKLMLIVRQESEAEIRRYAHLGTGNYNPSTARLYTDLSLLTCDEEITSAVHSTFNFLTARSELHNYKPLFVSPIDLAKQCIAVINREADHARRRRPARIIAKVNALLDQPVIEALYRASRAGVEIDLLVRGPCALRPGVRGLSHRIRVRSIIGRFLEHSRIFYVQNGDNPELYIGSADWMPRNLYERVEVMTKIKNPGFVTRIYDEILMSYLVDNRKARILLPDGKYIRAYDPSMNTASKNGARFSAQDFLIDVAEGKVRSDATPAAFQLVPYPKMAS